MYRLLGRAPTWHVANHAKFRAAPYRLASALDGAAWLR